MRKIIILVLIGLMAVMLRAEEKALPEQTSERAKPKKVKLGDDSIDLSKANINGEIEIGEFTKTKKFKNKDRVMKIKKRAFVSPSGDYIVKAEHYYIKPEEPYAEWGEDEKTKLELYSKDGSKLFEKYIKRITDAPRYINECRVLKDAEYIVVGTDDFYGKKKLQIYNKKGDIVHEIEGLSRGDFWIPPTNDYILFKIKSGGKETLYRYAPEDNIKLHESKKIKLRTFSDDGISYIIQESHGKTGKVSSSGLPLYGSTIYFFKKDKLIWNKEIELELSPRFILSKTGSYLIMRYLADIKAEDNTIISSKTLYDIYNTKSGQLVLTEELSIKEVEMYKKEIVKKK